MSHQRLRSCSVSRSQPSTPMSTFEGPAQALAQLLAKAALTNAITTLGGTAGPRMLLSTALVLMKSIPLAGSSRSLAWPTLKPRPQKTNATPPASRTPNVSASFSILPSSKLVGVADSIELVVYRRQQALSAPLATRHHRMRSQAQRP